MSVMLGRIEARGWGRQRMTWSRRPCLSGRESEQTLGDRPWGTEGPGALQSVGLRRTRLSNISVRLQEGQDRPETAWPKARCAGRRRIVARSWVRAAAG